MFGWLFKSPEKKLEEKIAARYTAAVELQRNGKLREYGALMAEISELEAQLASMSSASNGEAG